MECRGASACLHPLPAHGSQTFLAMAAWGSAWGGRPVRPPVTGLPCRETVISKLAACCRRSAPVSYKYSKVKLGADASGWPPPIPQVGSCCYWVSLGLGTEDAIGSTVAHTEGPFSSSCCAFCSGVAGFNYF